MPSASTVEKRVCAAHFCNLTVKGEERWFCKKHWWKISMTTQLALVRESGKADFESWMTRAKEEIQDRERRARDRT